MREEQPVVGRAQVDEREAARRRLATPPPSGTVVDTTRPEVVVAGPRPRASMLATLSLVFGVVAALALLTGLLTGPAVAVGAIAALFGFGGLSATTRRHVAGKSDALFGIALGLATVVVGALTLTGTAAVLRRRSQLRHPGAGLAADPAALALPVLTVRPHRTRTGRSAPLAGSARTVRAPVSRGTRCTPSGSLAASRGASSMAELRTFNP